MFSRRHPYLFFLLIFSAIFAFFILACLILLSQSAKYYNIEALGVRSGEKVGIIEITGMITSPRHIISSLKRFRDDDSVKAIVLRIETPGGSVGPAQEIFREVRKTTVKKKIIASMGSVAASGGYYIAAGSDGIVASPGTITGSIGVVLSYTNFQDILEKIGLYPVVVKSGDYKDIGSPTRKMTEEEEHLLQDMVDKIHKQFISAIAEGRKMDPAEVETLADGRIILGEDAVALGLVDRLGNLEDAVEWAGKLGGIEGDIQTVYAREKKLPLISQIIDLTLEALSRYVNSNLVQSHPEPKFQYSY